MSVPTAPILIQLSTKVTTGQKLPQPIRFQPKMVDPALDTAKFDTVFYNGGLLLSDTLFSDASIQGRDDQRLAMGDRRVFERLLQLYKKGPKTEDLRARGRARKNMEFLVKLYFPRASTIRLLGERFKIDGAEAISLPAARPKGQYRAVVDLKLTPMTSGQPAPVRGYSLDECRRRRLIVQKRIYNSLWDHQVLQAYFRPESEDRAPQPSAAAGVSLPAQAPARRGARYSSAITRRSSYPGYSYGRRGGARPSQQRHGGTRRRARGVRARIDRRGTSHRSQ